MKAQHSSTHNKTWYFVPRYSSPFVFQTNKDPGTNKDSLREDNNLNEPILLKKIAIIMVYLSFMGLVKNC